MSWSSAAPSPRRDGVLLSVLVHVLIILWFQFGPDLHLFEPSPEDLDARRQEFHRQQERERDDRRFVFVQPRVDLEALEAATARQSVGRRSAGTGT